MLSDAFAGEWVQVSGSTTVVDVPEALDGLVAYFRSISGEHPDWDEYRQAMIDQGKVLIRLVPEWLGSDQQRWLPAPAGSRLTGPLPSTLPAPLFGTSVREAGGGRPDSVTIMLR